MYCKTQVHSCRQYINQWTYARSVVNVEFPSQLIKFFITGGYIFFCEYHVSWKCGLINIFAYLNCDSIQLFCNNRSSISSLFHRNVIILHLRQYYWHEPMCISQEVHMESLSQSMNKPNSKIFILIPIDTVINII